MPEIAALARQAWGLDSVSSVDVEHLCEQLNIEIVKVAMNVPDAGMQAFLLPRTDGGFTIEVDPEPRGGWRSVPAFLRDPLARHRSRFLVAHELAHTLFYTNGPQGPERIVPDSDYQERFCDEFARALLVPPWVAAGLPFTPQGALAIQNRFDVSMEIALRSLVATHHDQTVGWLLLPRADKMLVQWTSATQATTAALLPELRQLISQAVDAGMADGCLGGGPHRAHALFLDQREQVVVTWDHSSSS